MKNEDIERLERILSRSGPRRLTDKERRRVKSQELRRLRSLGPLGVKVAAAALIYLTLL